MSTLSRPPEDEARAGLRTFADLLRHHAEYRGDKVAMRFEDEALNYAQLDERASRVARGLIGAGVEPGTRVSHIGKNDPRYFDILGGCAKSGAVLSPISWRLAPPEMADLVNDFDIRLVFLSEEMAHVADHLRANCPGLFRIVGVDTPLGDDPAFDDWIADHSGTDPNRDSGLHDVLLQIHTSGTTGRPKGAMLTNGNIMALARHAETGDVADWHEDDIVLVPLPLFHSGGTCFSLYGLFVGATTYLTREPRPDQMFEAFKRASITKAGFVPAVIQMVVHHPDFDRDKVQSLKTVYYGGAPITAALLETAMESLGCGFLQMFGMTESTTSGTTLMPWDHDVTRPELLTSCGRLNSDTQLKIVDADRKELPRGESGEIAMKSPCIMKGYHNRPRETAEVLVDGWYYTGDVGYLTKDGYLYIRDRLKDMIISGGENIYPAEVEQALARHPAVLEAGVIGVPSDKWGEEVKACVALHPGAEADEADIIAHCRTLLAGFKCPKSVDFHDALPRNANGKILKRVLREPYWTGIDRQVG